MEATSPARSAGCGCTGRPPPATRAPASAAADRVADDPRLSFAPADVRDEGQVQAAIERVLGDGDLRVCVN